MSGYQEVVLGSLRTTVSHHDFGKDGMVIDNNQDGKVDFIVVGSPPPKELSQFSASNGQPKKTDCSTDTRQVLASDSSTQNDARKFRDNYNPYIECRITSPIEVASNSKLEEAQKALDAGKEWANVLYGDFMSALKSGKVRQVLNSYEFTDSNGKNVVVLIYNSQGRNVMGGADIGEIVFSTKTPASWGGLIDGELRNLHVEDTTLINQAKLFLDSPTPIEQK